MLTLLLEDLSGRIGSEGDPAVRRLFPKAYEDPQEEARFEDLTRGFLIASKKGAIELTLATLSRGSSKRGTFEVSLDEDETNALLGCINDLRLVLGTLLEVTEEHQPREFLPPEDPRALHANSYLWLGAVQEALLSLLLGERGSGGAD